MIFSLQPRRTGRKLDAGACPNRVQEPRAYEVPQHTGSGTTVRHSMQQPPGKEQLSHTDAAIATQPHSTHSTTRPDRHRKDRPAGLSPDPSQHFTSPPPPPLPPKGTRPSFGSARRGGKDEWSAHHKMSHSLDPGTGIDCPLLAAAADDDLFPILTQPKSGTLSNHKDTSANVPVSICAAPPSLPPKPRPLAVPISTSPGAT